MAIPAAPTITQTVTTPVMAGTEVATLFEASAETYAIDGTSSEVEVVGDKLQALIDLNGSIPVSVTATNVEGTGPPAAQTLTFTVDANPWDDVNDSYAGNPQLPPPLTTEGRDAALWEMFLVAATNAIVPGARNGVDYCVARADKYAAPANVAWNDTLLGPRPDAAIEAEARRLAAEWPVGTAPIQQL